MKVIPHLLPVVLASAMLVGCSQQEQETTSTQTSTQPAAPSGSHTHADGSSHASHDDSDASHSHGHSHGGEVVALGEKQVLDFTVTARQEGPVAAGQEAVFLIETSPATEAVRLWVGDEQATNSVRSRAEGGPTSFHAHAMVPESFTDDSRLWVEVQTTNGVRGSVSFDLTATANGSHSHDGEAHSHDDHSHEHGEHGHSH